MLVYGDRSERIESRACLDRLAADLRTIRAMPRGVDRHSQLVSLLIEGGRLLQGVADADFKATGHDRRSPATDELTGFLVALGRAVCRSWDGHDFVLPDAPGPPLPDAVDSRVPEGFAFYAVYPEAYAEAARSIALCGPPCVIGIRSIGTALGAVAAAAVGASSFATVRPFGHPYARKIAIAPELERELLAKSFHYLIVDEGPGQSGSSFGAVADWLQDRGVPLERIAFMPSHGGEPGPEASEAHRERWRAAQRAVADLSPRLPKLLAGWAKHWIGPLDSPLVDISAGAWRAHAYRHESQWSAANPVWERRKFLARSNGETWLVKFAGLGSVGARKLAIAEQLHAQRLIPEPRGLVHGFLVECWHDDATRLTPSDRPLAEIARYLGTRARLFPARETDGASLGTLLRMARHNAGLVLGEEADRALARWEDRLPSLSKRVLRVHTDNRLEPHEWLRLRDGTLLKSDALDHHSAHDLVGAQDIAWDVAGASVEFGLELHETALLAAGIGRAAGRPVDPELLQFMTVAYLAFRLGQASLSAAMLAGDQAERHRFAAAYRRYEHGLRDLLLQQTRPAISRKSALGLVAE